MQDVATCIELGYNADVVSWRGIAAPKGTPQNIIEYLINGFEKMSKDEEFINFLKSRGIDLQFVKGEAFGEWLAEKHEDYGKIAKMAGVALKK